ncbi:hypothetical protein HMPREF9444_01730 [Succinatimonas hippei YIT 12066]|uniref:Uncharacterized protein n=1 Tax=Succinatimonas hippei (strain DSM 22608 / JCM 16073 / KCTC 15190 / YIT 12066) TaxID=762983 RepID=E8LLV7_SUCHY|nr:hypothetical protein HMPREF9444_01730 [Succinatimonas hippei YIT 12066]
MSRETKSRLFCIKKLNFCFFKKLNYIFICKARHLKGSVN